MKYSDLIISAKAFYPLKGSHGWNHILDVLEKAKAMTAIKNQMNNLTADKVKDIIENQLLVK